ncbi:YihY/virulence factor BrkB family protein [Pirellulimonas nuda]|nr:YihY/virulence factor BrkB family protein [Pirellulimonas nuda]
MHAYLLRVLRSFAEVWTRLHVPSAAAAVAFYTLLSLAPILVFATAIATHFLSDQQWRTLIEQRLTESVNPELGKLAASVLESGWYEQFAQGTLVTTSVSGVLLVISASAMFVQLRQSLSEIFASSHQSDRSAIRTWLVGRSVSAAFAMAGGVLLLASLAGTVALHAASNMLSEKLGVPASVWNWLGYLLVAAIIAALFGLLPTKRPPLGCLLVGVIVSTIGFGLGRWAFGAYIQHSLIATAYGPASSLVIFLLWVYYSTTIILTGAVLSEALARQAPPSGEG